MKNILTLLSIIIFVSCNPRNGNITGEGDNVWLIPSNEIFDGGPGKDGIPSVDNPVYISAEQADFLEDEDLVIVVAHGDVLKVYPHPILDWHEIVNDQIQDFHFALTYCPLTGTAINWNRNLSGTPTTFGVSGLLYNSNLIPYDRETDSNWSQMYLSCVNGELAGNEAQVFAVYEGNWASVKDMQDLQVLSTDTGFSRDYQFYPYGDYRTNNGNIIFPVSNTDTRRQAKARCLGVFMDDQPKVFGFEDFESEDVSMIVDEMDDRKVCIVGDKSRKYITAFLSPAGSTLELVRDQFPIILEDGEGTQYDVFGRSVNGDEDLLQPKQFIGYWFSWAAFYPDLDLYNN